MKSTKIRMNDDTMKSPSVTAASNPTKNDSKRKYFYENPQFFGEMKKSLETGKLKKKRTKRAKISSKIYHEQK